MKGDVPIDSTLPLVIHMHCTALLSSLGGFSCLNANTRGSMCEKTVYTHFNAFNYANPPPFWFFFVVE